MAGPGLCLAAAWLMGRVREISDWKVAAVGYSEFIPLIHIIMMSDLLVAEVLKVFQCRIVRRLSVAGPVTRDGETLNVQVGREDPSTDTGSELLSHVRVSIAEFSILWLAYGLEG